MEEQDMKQNSKTIIILACIASFTIIASAGAYGYFSRGKEVKTRDMVTRVMRDFTDPDDKGVIQWKYSDESDDQWRTLLSMEAVLPESKKPEKDGLELRANNGYIQYLNEDGEWVDIISQAALQG